MHKEVLRMERVTYRDQGIPQLRDFELNVYEGEIMGLLPINAYGLPAFLHILLTNPRLYYGYVYYRDRLVNSWQDMKRGDNRISVIGGKSSLVEGQSVLSNVFILRPGFKHRLLRMNTLRKQLQPFLEDIGLEVSPDIPVEKLTVFQRVLVEILRAVVAGSHLVVLLEISTIVNDSEITHLHEIVRHYAAGGMSFLYVSPHFEELFQICDRVAVMTNGSIVKVLRGTQMNAEALLNFDQEYDARVRRGLGACRHRENGGVTFEAKNISGEFIKNMNFRVQCGECLVLQNLDNRIFEEFVQFITGEKPVPEGGFWIDGKKILPCRDPGMAVVLERPGETMLFDQMSYLDNLCMTLDRHITGVWMERKVQKSIRGEYARLLGEKVFDERVGDLTQIQKTELVYARVMLQKPKIVFCIQPFKGADMTHRMRIWELQKMLLARKIAVVILAVNMADALSLADRTIRIEADTVLTEYQRKDFNKLPMNVPWSRLYH